MNLTFVNELIPVITIDAKTNEVLMQAYATLEAVKLSLSTKKAHYFSRSRNSLWLKGETSGNWQKIITIYTDCDKDCLIYKVEVNNDGASCHLGYNSCFFREVKLTNDKLNIIDLNHEIKFDPKEVYKKN